MTFLRFLGRSSVDPPGDHDLFGMDHALAVLTGLQVAISRCVGRDEWGVKDPRITWLWPLYERVFKGFNPHIIITRRDHQSIARSWVDYGKIDTVERGLELAAMYDQGLDEIIKDLQYPYIELKFEDWWNDLDGQAGRLSEFIGRELDLGHFDPSLKRS